MNIRPSAVGLVVLAAILLLGASAPVASAEPIDGAPVVSPPPPPPPTNDAAVLPAVAATPTPPALPVAGSQGPAPDARERPPEPPPPGWAVPGWDLDWRSRGSGLGPPLPPPDPFAPRSIQLRHDTRVVSLDARRKAVMRVPQWVDVIGRTDLEEWRPLGLGTFAGRMPNVMIGDGGNPSLSMPVIRGLGGQRVKILTDGVWPASSALGFHGGTLSLWDPESTDRMEIYHGPGVYLKGIDSPGGMINIVPRRPRRHGRLSADTRLATGFTSATNTWRGRAEADVGKDRWAALVGVTWNTWGNRDTGGGTLDPSSFRQLFADLAADYFLDNRSRIGITAQYARNYNVRSPSATATDITDPSFERIFVALTVTSFDVGSIFGGTRASISLDTFFQEEDQAFAGSGSGLGSEDDSTRFDVHLEGNLYLHPCHDTWAELTLSYANLERSEQILSDGAVCGNSQPLVADSEEGLLDKPIDLPSRYANCGVGVVRSYEAEEILLTTLVEDQYHTSCWDIYSGVRLDLYHLEDNQTGRDETDILVGAAGGIARHFTPRVTGFANASIGWRRASLYELTATAIVDGATIFGNPELDPEMHANLELGVKSSNENRVSFQAAVFGHYVDDFIGPVDIAAAVGDEKELHNLEDVLLFGAEVAGAWRPCRSIEGWELFGSLGTTRSTDEALVANVPLLWRTGARYSVPRPCGHHLRRWFAEAAVYGATDSTDGRRGGDAYATADLLFGVGLDSRGCSGAWLGCGVTNLFDVDYTPPASVLAAPGIGFFVNAGFRF